MTYIDHYTYPKSHIMDDDLRRLRDASNGIKPRLFVEYCEKAIAAKESGGMPLRDAAYSIARTMFINELKDPLFEEITSLAGELELPAQFVDGDPERGWSKLRTLVGDYSRVT